MAILTTTPYRQALKEAVKHLGSHDPRLFALIQRYPAPTITPHKNYYTELVQSIISQQLSVKAADAIEKRFVGLFDSDDFPTPEQILEKDIEQFRAVGLSRPKARYIQDLAFHILDGTVRFGHLDTLSNDEVIAELTKVKGIGVWTAHMFLLFCMGRLDVLPVGDLGIKNGIQRLYDLPTLPSAEDMEHVAQTNHWHPYESVASWYIWQSLDNKPAL